MITACTRSRAGNFIRILPDVGLCSGFGHHQASGDLGVCQAFADQGENLEFAFGEVAQIHCVGLRRLGGVLRYRRLGRSEFGWRRSVFEGRVARRVSQRVQQAPHGARSEDRITSSHRLHGTDQIVRFGVLEQVARRACLQRLDHGFVGVERCEHQHSGGYPGCRSDTRSRLHPVELRHPDVHQRDIRLLVDHQGDAFFAVGGLPDDFDVLLSPQQHPEPCSD